VQRLLEERPVCEIRWDEHCTGESVDVDEIMGRGVGGSIMDESNLQTTCRSCHHQKTIHPAEAVRRGFTIQRSSKPL
jgi:5-methylcytosine-specific restriction endonuclease McrA